MSPNISQSHVATLPHIAGKTRKDMLFTHVSFNGNIPAYIDGWRRISCFFLARKHKMIKKPNFTILAELQKGWQPPQYFPRVEVCRKKEKRGKKYLRWHFNPNIYECMGVRKPNYAPEFLSHCQHPNNWSLKNKILSINWKWMYPQAQHQRAFLQHVWQGSSETRILKDIYRKNGES